MFEGFEVPVGEYLLDLLKPKPLASIAALLLLAAILLVVCKKTSLNTRILVYGSMAIVLAFVLSYIRIIRLPNAGTITLASMLPLFVFAYIGGPRAGIIAGLCYGMLQYFQDPFFVHWAQFLLDYPLAFSMLGLAGLFRKQVFMGALLGSFGRFLCHFFSGVVFFASYAGDQNVLLYSAIYNMSYLLPDALICLAILAVPNIRAMITRLQNAMGDRIFSQE